MSTYYYTKKIDSKRDPVFFITFVHSFFCNLNTDSKRESYMFLYILYK